MLAERRLLRRFPLNARAVPKLCSNTCIGQVSHRHVEAVLHVFSMQDKCTVESCDNATFNPRSHPLHYWCLHIVNALLFNLGRMFIALHW